VLASLVIMVVVSLAFFSSVTTESVASKSQTDSSAASQLADSVTKLVMATISEATSGKNGTDTVAWASQPGMIRTWDTSGNLARVFRLYSSGNMIDTSFSAGSDASELLNWKSGAPADSSYNALWCDLNSPTSTANATLVYPIVAPPAALDVANGVPTDNPATATQEGVQGFDITTSPGFSGSSPSAVNNPAPMPVKWIYVLKDGQLVAPTGNGTSATVAGATASNPIVGRTAFWTDDETCKVNLNTASEGVFWDVPRCAGIDEVVFGANPPTQGEWQRIPGHPATTSLSAVFPQSTGESDTDFFKRLTSYNPRTAWGGSEMGTKPMGSPARFNGQGYPWNSGAIPPLPAAVPSKTDRLLASSDELYYTNNGTRTPLSTLSSDDVQRRQFFLTSASRAPETNLFNQPRISIWPITWMNRGRWSNAVPSTPSIPSGDPSINRIANNPSMEPSEKLIAFAASLGEDPDHNNELFRYFFTRQNSTSASHDYDGILRNREIYAYLRGRLNNNIPGFGGNLAAKWGADTDQILTSTFDFLRSTVNLAATSSTDQTKNYYYSPLIRSSSTAGNYTDDTDVGYGQVVPIKIASARGFGRFPTITEASLVFYATDRNDCYGATSAESATLGGANVTIDPAKLVSGNFITTAAHQTTRIGMVLLFEVFNPVTGFPNLDPVYGVRVSGPSFTVDGTAIGFPDSGRTNLVNAFNEGAGRRDDRSGAYLGIHSPFAFRNGNPVYDWKSLFPKRLGTSAVWGGTTKIEAGGSHAIAVYPFYATGISVDPASNSFSFAAQPTTVEIYAPDPANPARNDPVAPARLVQTFTIDFSQLNGTYPTPIAPRFFERQPVSGNTTLTATLAGNTVTAPGNVTLTIPALEVAKKDRSEPTLGGLRYNYGYSTLFDGIVAVAPDSRALVNPTGGSRDYNNRINALPRGYTTYNTNLYIAQEYCLMGPYDTAISMQLDPSGSVQGDPRMLAAQLDVPATWFQRVPVTRRSKISDGYSTQISPTAYITQLRVGGHGDTSTISPYKNLEGLLNAPLMATSNVVGDTQFAPVVSGRFNKDGIPRSGSSPTSPLGEWANGPGFRSDGGLIPKPGEGMQSVYQDAWSVCAVPYFTQGFAETGQPIFSPNRQLASPVELGAIPTGAMRNQPWQTLLFCPNPLAGTEHRGSVSPPDHLYLDLFTMPVAEPYPMSEALSTAGKINLNYRMEPFGHMTRQTGLYALLKSTKIAAFLLGHARYYKVMREMSQGGGSRAYPEPGSLTDAAAPALSIPGFPAVTQSTFINSLSGSVPAGMRTRFDINVSETLRDFDTKFDGGDLFRSASQICEMFLVPDPTKPSPTGSVSPAGIPTTLAATKSWWSGTSAATDPVLTGDNSRESPYNQIYPRVTTQSNTFTVHMRVQGLKKRVGSAPDTWEEGKDLVVSEYRGSSSIERFVDPNDPALADIDFVTDTTKTLAPYYKWRVIGKHQFAP
jgi:uncharacterized protein (TIGR02600 family)